MNHFINFILSSFLSLFIVNATINTDNLKPKSIIYDTVYKYKTTEKPIVYIQQNNSNVYYELLKTFISVLGGCISTLGIAYLNNKMKIKKSTNNLNN